MANSGSGESVIERVTRVLAAFDAERTRQTAASVARRAGLPPSTGHRLVAELTEAGWLERDEDGMVRVGMRIWELTTRGSLALGLRQAALPFMESVQAELGEHTQLAVRENDEVLFLERLSAPGSGSNIARVAGRLPLNASSSGLVLLASAPPEVKERVLARPLRALTPETIAEGSELRRKLAEVQRLGYAAAPGSVEDAATGIAVPVRSGAAVIAALGVVLPRERADTRAVVRLLLRAAEGIAAALPHTGSRSMGIPATET